MGRSAELCIAANTLRLLALCLCVLFLHGCATPRKVQEKKPPPVTTQPETAIARNEFSLADGEDVVGQLAYITLENGDTLPDIARHFSLGIEAISAANPGVDIWVPRAGEKILLPLRFILPNAPRDGIVVNLATMRLFQFKRGDKPLTVATYPVGVGTSERPTPTGQMYVARKTTLPTWYVPASIAKDYRQKGDPLPAAVPPGPQNPLGEFALYLNKAGYLIHGTNKPASIGLKATNGCLRLYPENVEMLYRDTPVNTPVVIVNQPYLVGQAGSNLYLEAHTPLGDSGAIELKKIYALLRNLEKKTARRLDWPKIETIIAEAKGIPVSLPETDQNHPEEKLTLPIEVRHPNKLQGRPELPELRTRAWYVLAADMRDQTEAQRMAAIICHQGPSIPARVLAKRDGYRVIAGPFADTSEARKAVKRLKIDLGIDGVLIDLSERDTSVSKNGI